RRRSAGSTVWCAGHRREARRVLMPDALRLSGLHSHQTVGRIRRLRRIRQKAVPNRGPDKALRRIRHKPCRTLQKSH
ncbi:hypothetical protein, partial [Shigella sonnei]